MKETNPSQVPGTYYFLNLGCPKNLVDAERTAARLEVAGWKGVLSPEDAEIVVVTTCAFISEAEEESVDEILSAASRKREGQKLVVLGCLVSREGGALPELFPEVDLFLGVDEMESLPERLMDLKSEVQPEKRSPAAASGRKLFTPPHIAYLRIADGCSNHCSFCTIPSIRGELRSCDRKEILDEAEGLVDAGVRELVVIAQDTGAWGLERKGGERLCSLLEDLSKTAGATWIRLMYLHPAHIDLDRLLRLLESGIICRYLDLPIQHVSDRILKQMGRGYTRAYLERIFCSLKGGVDGLVIRTTVMVGFPGETEAEYQELVSFLEEFPFDHLGVFVYSPEEETPAASMRPRVPIAEALRRKDEILDIQMDLSHDRLRERVGRTENVIVDKFLSEDERPYPEVWGIGRFYGQAYEIDGVTFLSGSRHAPGRFVEVCIDEAQAYDLFASIR